MRQSLLVLAIGVGVCAGCSSDEKGEPKPGALAFPEPGSLSAPAGEGSFRFGAASAATQIEDDNPNTDWYVFTQPESEGGLGNGTFVGDAVRGYSKAIDDIELMKELNLDSYRFSVEWGRVEPARDQVSEEALQHYSDFIDALLAADIRPNVTVHHFSNPIWVYDPRDLGCEAGPSDTNLCGFGHPVGGPQIIEEAAEHARLLAERYGDRVDDWATINEPVNYLVASYGIGYFPPGATNIFGLQEKFIPVIRDFLEMHAAIYAAIKEADTIDADGDGVAANVGLTLSVVEWAPARDNQPSTDPEDVAARDRVQYVFHHLVPDSIQNGSFDANLDGTPDEDHPAWANTLDWLGVQYYSRTGVTGKNGLIPVIELTPCFSTVDLGSCLPPTDPTWCVPSMGYEYYPEGLFNILADFSDRWPALPLVVSEAGLATEVGERRAENVVRTLEQISRAREADVDVRGYYYWSLTDNFEWAEGYEPRFGLYRVDYQSYERSPTLGAEVFSEIAAARSVSGAQREEYGGLGPMTPEDPDAPVPELCSDR